ncbi:MULTISPECIES: hypothetical protein [Thermomonospora]|uniref:hypothetical protein n=1 Tax=Thermomonospora TaxID=2019 RepID=UPI00019ED69A|nr:MULTISPECIES: hypothetical protein [Thermomonospora]
MTHLEALRLCLEKDGDGFGASLVRAWHGPVVLRVIYPHSVRPPEDIACDFTDGEWWFVWSDGRTIGPADDPEGVARAIVTDPWREPA